MIDNIKYIEVINNLHKLLEKEHQVIKVNKIKIESCEGPIKKPHFKEGEEFDSLDQFQYRVNWEDHEAALRGNFDKCYFYVYFDTVDSQNNKIHIGFDLGNGYPEIDVKEQFKYALQSEGYGENLIIE